jgi:uncharacterized ubiquitin-like protein YukD
MATIKISIFNSRNNTKHDMQVPDSVKAQTIVDTMIKQNLLEKSDAEGNQISYELILGKKQANGQKLKSKSLAEAGVKDGDQLILHAEIIAA